MSAIDKLTDDELQHISSAIDKLERALAERSDITAYEVLTTEECMAVGMLALSATKDGDDGTEAQNSPQQHTQAGQAAR